MADPSIHDARSQALADEIRRFLVGANTGGIATIVAFAASLAGNKVHPAWALPPITFFLLGVVLAAFSALLAQNREIRRRDAAEKNVPLPPFNFLQWSWLWNWLSLGAFVAASILGLWTLAMLSF
jgi:hypothetical protein